VVVSTSDDVSELTDAALAALDDAFARHVAIARERLGAPDRRSQGKIASVTWFLPDGRLVQVVRGTTGGWIEMATPDADELRGESDV
jgi:hypothetical protein